MDMIEGRRKFDSFYISMRLLDMKIKAQLKCAKIMIEVELKIIDVCLLVEAVSE